jgi:hypothetical protein
MLFDSLAGHLLECSIAAGKCSTRWSSDGAEVGVCAAGGDSFPIVPYCGDSSGGVRRVGFLILILY